MQITIIGLGLIGGSLALSLKRNRENFIIGYDVDESNIKKAVELKVIDRGSTKLEEAVKDSDFIAICTPVGNIIPILKQLDKFSLKSDVIVFDTGSVKKPIMEWVIKEKKGNYQFIGAHPMAGSHKSGVSAASEILFENAYFILTPIINSDVLVKEVEKLLVVTNANIIYMDWEEHDKVVGAISHLPHIVAAMLVNQVAEYNKENILYNNLMAGGFKDITRIAASNPVMWRDIVKYNKGNILRLISDWQKNFELFRNWLQNDQDETISNFFASARSYREKIPEQKTGALFSLYDCFVNVPDTPGIIGEITTILGDNLINLSNIEIIENREELFGVLRLSFRSLEFRLKAVQLLQQNGYHAYVLT